MSRFALSIVSVCLLLLWSASLAGSDSDDLRQKAKAIQKEAAALAEKGNKEEAAQLEAKARELLETAERRDHEQKHGEKPGGPSPKVEMLEAHLKELLVKEQQARENKASEADLAELRERITATRATIEKLRSEQKHRPHASGPEQKHAERSGRPSLQLAMLEEHLKDLLIKEQQAREAKSSEGDLAELRQKIAATKAQIDALRSEEKRRPDAFDHEHKQAEKPAGPSPKIEMLEAHLKELLVKEQQARETKASEADLAELRQRIAATKEKLDALRSEQERHPDAFGTKPENLDAVIHRLKHLRTAAEHLRAAGALELSQHVNEQAEQMEREVHQAQERRARSLAEHDGNLPGQIEEMRREMQRLRAEVEELRRQVKEK